MHRYDCASAQGLCVVIDVLRAFTTAAFAFAGGAEEIIFVSTIEEAFQKKKKDPSLLLMGEQEGKFIEGFHYGNSPNQIRLAPLSGRRLVQRTSSGTQGVIGCSHVDKILVASFVVAEATLKRIIAFNPSHVTFIVTGRNNGDEDLALAEYLQNRLLNIPSEPSPFLSRVRSSPCAARMLDADPCEHEHGMIDLDMAVHIDRFSFAMEVFREEGELIGKKVLS